MNNKHGTCRFRVENSCTSFGHWTTLAAAKGLQAVYWINRVLPVFWLFLCARWIKQGSDSRCPHRIQGDRLITASKSTADQNIQERCSFIHLLPLHPTKGGGGGGGWSLSKLTLGEVSSNILWMYNFTVNDSTLYCWLVVTTVLSETQPRQTACDDAFSPTSV